jgi:predicted O-linked N-acetylglucosamine transferase (SPINDLY family)
MRRRGLSGLIWPKRGSDMPRQRLLSISLLKHSRPTIELSSSRRIWRKLRWGEAFALPISAATRALLAYDKARSLKPGLTGLAGSRLQAKMFCCDWRDLEQDWTELIGSIEVDTDAVMPFDLLAIPSSLDVRLRCSQSWVARNSSSAGQARWRGEHHAHDRIRVGYVSADFRRHPVAYLTAGIFEGHDR